VERRGPSGVTKAVILARGLGTRMRRADAGTPLQADQVAAADRGVKGMIPIARPFLDYILSALADAGFTDACLVIGPEHQAVRDYYEAPARPRRIRLHFAVQEHPLGTADAVLAAEGFAGSDLFLVCNADNYYPVSVLSALRGLEEPGLAGFDREALVQRSNISAERIGQFALLTTSPDGFLANIVEKPDAATASTLGHHARVSMNCWVFGPGIFPGCRLVKPSPRGELEIQDAVRLSIATLGERYRVVPAEEGVLDLSNRSDIATVATRLAGVEPRP
jgi:glucose-1-phosphate thymidylyltransferase